MFYDRYLKRRLIVHAADGLGSKIDLVFVRLIVDGSDEHVLLGYEALFTRRYRRIR